jgi:predicted TIM-barrel fold metal-dependent hydrolase
MLLDFPVVDAHFHWWSREANSYPWLAPGSARPALGDHRPLMRNFTFEDYMRDVGSWVDVRGGVHVEAGCADPVGESIWIGQESERHHFPLVHVARVDLTHPEAADRVFTLAQMPHVRGVRMRLNADPRIAGRSGIADEPDFRRGFKAVAERRLIFELSIFPPQAQEGVGLAHDFPETGIVLNHLGWPRIAEGIDTFRSWKESMTALAACPNVSVKLSMLWPIDRSWRRDVIRPYVLEALAQFGTGRVMFGSNYPIELVMGSTEEQLTNLVDILRELSRYELQQVFRSNALRVFALDLPHAGRSAS